MDKQEIIKKMMAGKFVDLVEYFQSYETSKIQQLTELSITTGDISYYFLVDYIANKNSDWKFYSLASNMLFSDFIHITGAGDLSYQKLKQAISLNPSTELMSQILGYWKFPDATIPQNDIIEVIEKLDNNVNPDTQKRIDKIKLEIGNI